MKPWRWLLAILLLGVAAPAQAHRLDEYLQETIVSVGVTVGDTVTANSSTEVIVIIGTESFEVTGTLSSSQVPSVKVGDAAGVEVDGVDGDIAGTVSQVGPVQSSGAR